MSRSRGDLNSDMVRARAAARRETASGRQSVWPDSLNMVDEDQLGQIAPADVIVLDHSPSLRKHVDSIFYAIVGCPACGMPGLITAQQYYGVVPVICPSDRCSCHYRIHYCSTLAYLPVN